jgi:hypothetical protein
VEKAVSGLKVTLHRSGSHTEFYWMGMTPSGSGYEAVLTPPGTEAVGVAFTHLLESILEERVVAKTPQYLASVERGSVQCSTGTSPGPPGVLWPTENPKRSRRGAVLALDATGAAAVVGDLAESPAAPPALRFGSGTGGGHGYVDRARGDRRLRFEFGYGVAPRSIQPLEEVSSEEGRSRLFIASPADPVSAFDSRTAS